MLIVAFLVAPLSSFEITSTALIRSAFSATASMASSPPIEQRWRRAFTVMRVSANENDSIVDDANASSTPTTTSTTTVFTQLEMQEMENVIVSFSQISDDTVRREKLASLFDLELAAAAENNDILSQSGGEIPRFAQLFQVALDTIGERVQASAREVASTLVTSSNEDDNNTSMEEKCGGDDIKVPRRVTREKSQEELQLWALIDMMVQSKTRVKMHMGKLGSKGEFR